MLCLHNFFQFSPKFRIDPAVRCHSICCVRENTEKERIAINDADRWSSRRLLLRKKFLVNEYKLLLLLFCLGVRQLIGMSKKWRWLFRTVRRRFILGMGKEGVLSFSRGSSPPLHGYIDILRFNGILVPDQNKDIVLPTT